MLILTLVFIALLIAIALFLFGWLWYSKKLFGKVFTSTHSTECKHMKKALILEFVSCFIISIAATIVFAPFDWYFGLINGLIISVLIVLPFAISDAIWSCEKVSLKLFFVKFGHKTVAISLAFMLAATLNNLFIPMVLR